MKNFIVFWILLASPVLLFSEEENHWESSVTAGLYMLPDKTYLNPVLSADKNHLHLEARYNYEDLETGSVFAGYSFQTGNTLELNVTPIIGGVFGNSNGIAPGFRVELNYWKLSLTSEGEYLFSTDEKESSFFYSWSEFSYSPAEWIWFGIAGQRTRVYKTDLEIQRGLFVGFGKGSLAVTGYIMNLGFDDVFGLISAEYQF